MEFLQRPSPKKIRRAPLLCWDFYADYLNILQHKLNDKVFLEKYLNKKTLAPETDILSCLNTYDALVLTDVQRKIQWTSYGFQAMTGYTPREAKGRKPSFLQGENTSPKTIKMLRTKLELYHAATADIVNYKKNGQAYTCHVHIEPVFDRHQNPTSFLAFEKEIASH